MITLEFVKRTRVNTFWVLPGSRAEFVNAGQAGFFTSNGNAKVVQRPGRKRRKATADSGTDSGSGDAAGDAE